MIQAAVTVDDKSEEQIAEFLKKAIEEHGAENVELVITSPKNPDATTNTRGETSGSGSNA